MRVTHTETREVEVVDDILCDRCGESHKGHIGNLNGVHIHGEGAYDSTYFPDMFSFKTDVCEKCTAEWFSTFKRNPLNPPPEEDPE